MGELLEVGRIVRPHGLNGELQVVLLTNRPERVAPGAVLVADGAELTVKTSTPHKNGYIVRVDGVGDRTAAEKLAGTTLFAPPLDEPADDDGYWVHELVGRRVVEVDGTERGTVESVEANPASDLLVLDDGALVPVDFIDRVEDDQVVIDPPDGLFEL